MRLFLFMILAGWSGMVSASATDLNFDVYLDDDPIGFHRVSIEERAEERRVRVEAEMAVEILFFNAFSYRHRADELWRGDCIFALETRTDDDGKPLRVEADRVGDVLAVRSGAEQKRLEGCVRTFAYWKPELLASDYLLNTQNGAYEPARLVELEPEPLRFNGRAYGAKRYRLEVGEEIRIDLWYDEESDWKALQTDLGNGRVLSYLRREG